MSAILGKKIGMTQVFTDEGVKVNVTAIEAGPCVVLSVRDKNLQVAFDPVDEKRLKRPQAGYFKKLNIGCRRFIREIKKTADKEYKPGEEIKADCFNVGDYVDVTGTSIGRGFQGGMRRWNWKGGPQTHGSMSHRRIGSIGSSTTPGRVWKGQHLPGHLGASRITVQNLKVIRVDAGKNLLLLKGAVPGNDNGYLVISKAKKRKPATAKPKAAETKQASKPTAKPAAKKK